MTFDDLLDQVVELLQRQGRVSYGALKRRFALDDDYLQDLKDELVDAQRLAADEDGKVLVWVGASVGQESENRRIGESEKEQIASSDARLSTLDPRRDAGERRQLTVMFCDLVGSTALSERLDPEELREVVRAYQETCTAVIRQYDGHIAQHLGDGLLVYFGYPVAHEDDAQRAARTALGIVEAIQQLSFLTIPLPRPLQVRIGIHTGLVVIGEIGSSEKREILALGETPNIAARLQGLAEPDMVVVSAATYRLVQGLFECQDLGLQDLKGISTPVSIYRVVRESAAQNRFEAAMSKGLTPLVGRELEIGLLRERWLQAKSGAGQVVLLSGEPGIGKSRLMQELKEHVSVDGATRIEFRCSPYHQNSALYPIIEHLQRLLQFAREDSPAVKLEKLQHTLSRYRFPQADTVPLLTALLSLPQPEGYPPLTLSPQKQKEKTQAALVAWLVEDAEQSTVYNTWEDVHWADPSTLEVLTQVVDQAPTARLYVLLTFRPEFLPPWGNRSHLSQVTLNRLGRSQVEAMVEQVTGGKALPPEVVQQIVAKTDGVPLFVEELTKTVVEAMRERGTVNREQEGNIVGAQPVSSSFPLGVPATLQDALMARLDRLGPAKAIAQVGAALGREFSYELLHAVSPVDETLLQQGLKQLVEAELVYQRGLAPRTHYLFKHALIQDVAYQSLLKSTRQQYHRQIAQVLAERFPETVEVEPELVAHHYTEAGQIEQAIPYWQKAGERANQRSAYVEAISHLTKGLELLKTLPDTLERTQHELTLQLALGNPLTATKSEGAMEVESVYTRALELCQQVGETPQLFLAMSGLWLVRTVRGELRSARELAEQLLRLAQNAQDPAFLLSAHLNLGVSLFWLGEFAPAREHLEQGLSLYDLQQYRSQVFGVEPDPGVWCLSYMAYVLWFLGYPDQALKRGYEALTLAQEISRPYSVAIALIWVAAPHYFRREAKLTQERVEAAIAFSTEQGFPLWVGVGTIERGWALAEQGQMEEGIAQIEQGLAVYRAMGTENARPLFLAMLAAVYGKVERIKEGLSVLAEALAIVDKTEARVNEAELYGLKGTLTLQSQGASHKSQVEEIESCFFKAIEIARKQQAKSLELRAATSLACLWQHQGKRAEARQLLAEIYGWFTEGFDTKDLQEAKALLQELSD